MPIKWNIGSKLLQEGKISEDGKKGEFCERLG